MESKIELTLKKSSLSLYALQEKILNEVKTVQDDKVKKLLSEVASEIKSIDNRLLKDFNVKFSDKTKTEILKFM